MVLAAMAVAVAAAGCGSGASDSRSDGATLFSRDCEMCHSLTGRPSPRQQGGDLLGLHMSRAAMLQFVREMPVPHRMSSAELATVADYVRSVEGRSR